MNLKKKILTTVLFFLFPAFFTAVLFAQDTPQTIVIDKENLPEFIQFTSKDLVFKEYQKIIEDNYKEIYAKRPADMIFFTHTITEADLQTLHKGKKDALLIPIASRCNISYDTIATLNKIENSTEELLGKKIIFPTVPGLFIKLHADSSSNAFEILLRENYADTTLTNTDYYYNIDNEEYVFLVNKRLSSTERAYFLDSGLGLPLAKDSFWISSEFGKRKNPVNGEWKNHNGIDLAAEEGTPVLAIKDGYVAYCIEKGATFGNYIILTHDTGKMSSVYAHLSSICKNQYDFVKKGDIIGYVGHTGMATGSHLHFEIRQGGVAQDPRTKLDLK